MTHHDYHHHGGGSSERQPNRPPRPSPNIYDPRQWLLLSDVNDASWVSQVRTRAGLLQPTDKIETGFVTWDQQEQQFPHLDQRLYLHDVSAPNPLVWKPNTVNIQVWDPVDRAIAEPKTGKRRSMKLNPITTHSLARWVPSEYAQDHPLEPETLPVNPSAEEKKRPFTSSSMMMGTGPKPKKKKKKQHQQQQQKPSKEKPQTENSGQQSPTVATVHYPLGSPNPTDLENPEATAKFAIPKPQQHGPPTPYPKLVPETPTVALYDFPMAEDSLSEDNLDDNSKLMSDFSRGLPSPRFPNSNVASSLKVGSKRQRPAQLDLAGQDADLAAEQLGKKRRTTPTTATSTSLSLLTNLDSPSVYQYDFLSEYDVEELQTAHPRLVREYYEARDELIRARRALQLCYTSSLQDPAYLSTAESDHRHGEERFASAASQIKVAMNKESAAGARDAATAIKQPRKGQVYSHHPHNLPKGMPEPRRHEQQPKSKANEKSVRFAGDAPPKRSDEMLRYRAGRAVGRYGLTSMRRGPFR